MKCKGTLQRALTKCSIVVGAAREPPLRVKTSPVKKKTPVSFERRGFLGGSENYCVTTSDTSSTYMPVTLPFTATFTAPK